MCLKYALIPVLKWPNLAVKAFYVIFFLQRFWLNTLFLIGHVLIKIECKHSDFTVCKFKGLKLLFEGLMSNKFNGPRFKCLKA